MKVPSILARCILNAIANIKQGTLISINAASMRSMMEQSNTPFTLSAFDTFFKNGGYLYVIQLPNQDSSVRKAADNNYEMFVNPKDLTFESIMILIQRMIEIETGVLAEI